MIFSTSFKKIFTPIRTAMKIYAPPVCSTGLLEKIFYFSAGIILLDKSPPTLPYIIQSALYMPLAILPRNP